MNYPSCISFSFSVKCTHFCFYVMSLKIWMIFFKFLAQYFKPLFGALYLSSWLVFTVADVPFGPACVSPCNLFQRFYRIIRNAHAVVGRINFVSQFIGPFGPRTATAAARSTRTRPVSCSANFEPVF